MLLLVIWVSYSTSPHPKFSFFSSIKETAYLQPLIKFETYLHHETISYTMVLEM